jgi:hypothetical protein
MSDPLYTAMSKCVAMLPVTGAPAEHHMRISSLKGKAADADRTAASHIHATASRHPQSSRCTTALLPRHHDGAGCRLCCAAQRAADVGVDGCEVRDALCHVVVQPAGSLVTSAETLANQSAEWAFLQGWHIYTAALSAESRNYELNSIYCGSVACCPEA